MKLRSVLSRLLLILALVSFVSAPSAAGMMAADDMAAMADMASMPEGMPCCPDQKQPGPDCPKSSPLATLCLAKCAPDLPTVAIFAKARPLVVGVVVPGNEVGYEAWLEALPPRPPRT